MDECQFKEENSESFKRGRGGVGRGVFLIIKEGLVDPTKCSLFLLI